MMKRKFRPACQVPFRPDGCARPTQKKVEGAVTGRTPPFL